MPDGSVDMILCDLPYGTTRNEWDSVIPLDKLWEQYNRVIKENGAIVLSASQPFTSALVMSNPKLFKYDWVWKKNVNSNFMLVNKQPLRHHESVLVFYRKQPTYNPQMTKGEFYTRKIGVTERLDSQLFKSDFKRKDSSSDSIYPITVLDMPRDERQVHPTQKPVELFKYLIRTYTNEGETILDNCMGSGTTAIACMDANRNYIGFELDETYYKKSLERIKNHATQTELFDFI